MCLVWRWDISLWWRWHIDIVDYIQTNCLFPGFFQGTNWALGGIATQSSTYSKFGKAQNAIDGRRASHWKQRSCTHTRRNYRPWWRVDLRADYKVNYVTVTNRKDCCANRLNGAEIRIGNSLRDNGNRNKRYNHLQFNSGIQHVPLSRATYKYHVWFPDVLWSDISELEPPKPTTAEGWQVAM